MKAIRIHQFGEPEVMVYEDVSCPDPVSSQIRIKVEVVGVNPVDTYIRAGTYPVLPALPYTPGKDIAGVIDSVGEGVEDFSVGDRVYSSGTLTGAYAEYAICSSAQVFRLPPGISFETGAAVGVPGATAWRALFIRGKGLPGEKVLIHGASGSVGSAAVQLAKGAGLQVYGTASTIEGLAGLEKYGIDGLYNHNDPEYASQMLVDNPGGFDLILEMLANQNLETDLGLLARSGRVVVIGSRGRIEIDPRATMGKELDIRGLALFNCTDDEMKMTQAALYAALEKGVYDPPISKQMSLEKAAQAHTMVMESGNCGKIILRP